MKKWNEVLEVSVYLMLSCTAFFLMKKAIDMESAILTFCAVGLSFCMLILYYIFNKKPK